MEQQRLDLELISELRAMDPDGSMMVKELLSVFELDTRQRIDQLRGELGLGDSEALRRSTHSIKGSSANVGAAMMSSIAKEMEDHSREQSLAGLPVLLDRLVSEFERALGELRTAYGLD